MDYEKLAEVSQKVVFWKNKVDETKSEISQAEANLYTAEKNLASYKRKLDELLKIGMSKTHLIADESLGGVLREFREVDRKAEVGEFVIRKGVVRKVTQRGTHPETVEFEGYYNKGCDDEIIGWLDGTYKTLEPTDIVHIDGERYRLVNRKAKVGDKVIYYKDGKSDGVATTCIGHNDFIDVEPYLTKGDDGETRGFADGYYRVLEPLEDD